MSSEEQLRTLSSLEKRRLRGNFIVLYSFLRKENDVMVYRDRTSY